VFADNQGIIAKAEDKLWCAANNVWASVPGCNMSLSGEKTKVLVFVGTEPGSKVS
jgi:hypothetical protein